MEEVETETTVNMAALEAMEAQEEMQEKAESEGPAGMVELSL